MAMLRLPSTVTNCAALLFGFASSGCIAQDVAFRFDDLDLRDPHVFVDFFTCLDVTDTPLVGFSVNGQLQQRIQTDADGNGQLDLSYLLEFLPLQPDQPTSLLDFGVADCSAPLATTECSPVTASVLAGDADLLQAGACSSAIAGTTGGYAPPVAESSAACFVSPAGTITLDIGGIPVALRQSTVAGSFDGTPPDGITNGLLRGFISEDDADATILPSGLPLIGGMPLSSILRGGNGNCASGSDVDLLEGERGWWFYLNYSATRVAVTGGLAPAVFADGFEPL